MTFWLVTVSFELQESVMTDRGDDVSFMFFVVGIGNHARYSMLRVAYNIIVQFLNATPPTNRHS
ncbi:hypothetical protein CI238_07698 [Colletotrichum incanum]|uniref:Uncharacterized protein n=1 Tax=Colletotrichum incanum TaxID=1573173 RepID=A0A161WGT1_COLIC|nr:hypothetical protein CI238_07698 [Colletotrichum incanum]